MEEVEPILILILILIVVFVVVFFFFFFFFFFVTGLATALPRPEIDAPPPSCVAWSCCSAPDNLTQV